MSVETLSAVLNMNVGDSTRKLVLIGLANHAHMDGTAAYAGVETLAKYANCSARTVQRCLAVLLETGFIREGDQSVISDKIPARYRPIAYEVAMRPETVDEWREAHRPGLRSTSAAHGKAGGARSAQVKRGDNLTPLPDRALDTKDEQVKRGDNLAPLPNDADSSSDADSGVTRAAFRGDTGDASGVTPVSPKPSSEPSSEPSTNYAAADAAQADDGSLPLDGIDGPPPHVETPTEQAYRIVRAYIAWYEQRTSAPVVNRERVVAALRKSFVLPALESGATEEQIKRALANTNSEFPSQTVWRRVLREAMGGTNLAVVSAFQTREAYTNDKTWGTEEQRQAEADRRKSMTPEEIEAEVAAALAPTSSRRSLRAAQRG